jgi:tetratricopeptide (TPR) repeat protein
MLRLSLITACAWLISVAASGIARADDADTKARAHYQIGRTAFVQGDYDRAIREFEIGYRNKPMPGFIYNIAQAAELAGQSQKALEHYQLYLELRPNAPERDDARQHIEALQRKLGAASKPDEPGPAVAPVAPAHDEPTLAPAPPAIVARPAALPPKRDHHKLVIGLSVAGAVLVVGAAAVGAVVGEQMQTGYHSWGTLGVTTH